MENLFEEKPTLENTPLFPEQGPVAKMSESVANTRAQGAVFVTGQQDQFNNIKQQLQETGTFNDELFNIYKEQLKVGSISEDLAVDKFKEMTTEEQIATIDRAVEVLDYRELSLEQLAIVTTVAQGGGELPIELAGKAARTRTVTEWEQVIKQRNFDEMRELQEAVNPLIAAQGFDNLPGAVTELAFQELTPFFNVLSKMELQDVFFEELGIEDKDLLLGNRRQQIREALFSLPPNERKEALRNVVDEISKFQSDPVVGPLLTRFNILENLEAIATDEVLGGTSPDNIVDVWIGNFESAVEAVFSVFVVGKLGTNGVKGVFKAHDANKIRKAAKNTGNRELQAVADKRLQGFIAENMGINPDEAVAATMPRPSMLANEREVVPRIAQDVADQAHIIRSEIFKNDLTPLGEVLTRDAKVAAVDKVGEGLNQGSKARVMPAMSVVEELPDGTGVGIRAVLGKTDTEAYSSFDELLPDLLQLDPELKNFKILRRNDEGKLVDLAITKEEFVDIVSTDFTKWSDFELLQQSKRNRGPAWNAAVEREARRRALAELGPVPKLGEILPEELFLEHTQVRKWHPADATGFAADTVRHTGLSANLIVPNARFSNNLVASFFRNYASEQRTVRLFDMMYRPFYKLSNKSKRNVAQVYEWSEDFARTEGISPDYTKVAAQFEELTPEEWAGFVALREGMDAQYSVFNMRLYNEYNGLGFKTARPVDPNAPMFHGEPLARKDIKGLVYDPNTGEQIKMSKAELEDIYANGGSVIKLDTPYEISGNKRATQILVDNEAYELGDLSKRPLEYYEGYNFRFYEDPYYIVKNTENIETDGAKGGRNTEALMTAGSQVEAEQWLSKHMRRGTRIIEGTEREVWVAKDDPNTWFEFKRARDIDQGDSSLFQKDALQREGRLFWDKRNQTPLPDVNGNQAELMDFVSALERGTAMAARQNNQEDLMRAVKHAFNAQYKDIVGKVNFATKDVREIVDDLKKKVRNTVDPDVKKRTQEALELAKYIRVLEGVESRLVPVMREWVMNLAVWADRTLSNKGFKAGKFSGVEKYAQTMDPIKALTRVPFRLFMVLRPFRQAILQGLQPMFLAGIDPVYVLSGRGFSDAFALRRGFIRRVDSTFDDGFSTGFLAKRMGLSTKEYRQLVKEFDRSGIVDIVDVHSFVGGTRKFNKIPLPKKDTVATKVGSGIKQGNAAFWDTFQRVGFDFGERINRTATYNVAWRRVLKEKGYKSLLEFTDDDWVKVRVDAENLSLAMNSTNKAPYQTGMLSVTTQFFSFTHKLTLALLGMNPAISNKEVMRLWVGMLAVYGADSIGQKDAVRQHLASMDLPDFEGKDTLIDYISAGALEATMQRVGTLTSDDWKRLDFSSFKPSLDYGGFVSMFYENMVRNPALGVLGPTGGVIGGFADGAEYAKNAHKGGRDMDPTEKFTRMANHMLAGTVPQYGDVFLALHSAKMQKLYRTSGENSNLRPTWNTLIARGMFGLRSEEEILMFDAQSAAYDADEVVRDMIKAHRKFIKQSFFLYENGEISQENFHEMAVMVGLLAESAPDGRKQEVIEGSFLKYFSDDDPKTLPVAVMAEYALNHQLSKPQLMDLVNRTADLTPEERERLTLFIDDAMETKNLNDEEMRQRMVEIHSRD